MTRLLAIMERLRDPRRGCPWDREQTFRTIAPYTIEEAYEVADAIERGDLAALREELGDLLFQVVFYAQMGREQGRFDFGTIAGELCDKMVRRHPHVFADARIETAADQTRAWEEHKAAERAAGRVAGRLVGISEPSALDGVPAALPALTRAEKLQKRAARVGFDWPDAAQVLDKIEEEIAELRAELTAPLSAGRTETRHRARIEDEIGDLFFALANLARHVGVDPEQALRGTSAKFERRFRRIEELLAQSGRKPSQASLDEMEALWQQAKSEE
ncbi:MAG: nucleoside triphosphate pyrophosphohydrolase [Alphaproteobacteria bacterium]